MDLELLEFQLTAVNDKHFPLSVESEIMLPSCGEQDVVHICKRDGNEGTEM